MDFSAVSLIFAPQEAVEKTGNIVKTDAIVSMIRVIARELGSNGDNENVLSQWDD